MKRTYSQSNDNSTQIKRYKQYKFNLGPKKYGNYSPATRSRAARGALDHTWRFVKATPAVDVDPRKFRHELVREKHWSLDNTQQFKPGVVSDFLNPFNDAYMQTAVGNLHKVSVSGKLTVMATFGKTFIRLNALEAERSYDWTALRNARYPDDVQSAWSNTCDLKSSAMNSLLNTLKNVAPETTAPVLRMTVFLSIQSQKARAEFISQNDMWEFKETCILADEYAYHDIILDNETSFRVKVFSELYPDANSLWSSVKNMIQFQKQASGDPFDTKPTLASDAPRGLSIQHVCTQNVHAVANFHGLRFQTLQGRGRDSLESVTLEVRPPEDMLKKKRAGESLAFLVQSLVEILDPSP